MQLRALREGKLKPDFEGGDMLLRLYAPKDKLWMNVIVPFALPTNLPCPVLIREDSPKLRELKFLSVSDTIR